MRIAVFLGSSTGPDSHRAATTAVGEAIARAGHGIVYGGAHVGLMGLLADAALAAGGEVLGVLPQNLVEREVGHTGLTRLELVGTMHERKARMADLADAFVALPGGTGTLDELIEIMTWAQLGLHTKPVALYDVDDFWTRSWRCWTTWWPLATRRPRRAPTCAWSRHPRSCWPGSLDGQTCCLSGETSPIKRQFHRPAGETGEAASRGPRPGRRDRRRAAPGRCPRRPGSRRRSR